MVTLPDSCVTQTIVDGISRRYASRRYAGDVRIGDLDGDGADEVLGGYYLLDSGGTPLWEQALGPHMDSVAVTEWDAGHRRAIRPTPRQYNPRLMD